eukprot:TRINITY_DN33667_c0_g1_i1.p1 TRINITY_DN33667_c0_g1~~TRINITY_DN33667_c0_g1_i1.p1  ORF type:complete len:264 (-),score=85.48 TRINITY_DN33667_c0_g1_i1:40-831(-)
MASTKDDDQQDIIAHVPQLRRYARALTGRQETGDLYVMATLDAFLADGQPMKVGDSPVRLFNAFHLIWSSSGAPDGEDPEAENFQTQISLTPLSREALLLSTIEEFPPEQISEILAVDPEEAKQLVDAAKQEMEQVGPVKVLIIEDEAIIALDLEGMVLSMGYEVIGIARTHGEAVALAAQTQPDVILADVQLADGSSGIEAVAEILERFEEVPAIFATAFPEKLLTGEGKEPAFVIAKPFTEDQIKSALSQTQLTRKQARSS